MSEAHNYIVQGWDSHGQTRHAEIGTLTLDSARQIAHTQQLLGFWAMVIGTFFVWVYRPDGTIKHYNLTRTQLNNHS